MRKAGYAWLWMGVTCLLSRGATSQPQPRTSNACYSSGGDCGIHSLTCEHGLVILVGDTHYGFKDRASYRNHTCQALLADCGAYVNRESCCGYDVNADCLTSFSREHRQRVKEDCDGKTTCQARATYVSGSCSKPRHVYNDVSSYSVISYACVNATSRRMSTASQPVSCGPRCTSTTTSKAAFEDRTGENNSNQKENDERMLQLIIGVSVGVGSGFIFLSVVLIFCWFRLRRKPQASVSVTNGTALTVARTISRRPSKANTLTSTMPSSHYSSFFYSDTLPSSHPGSIYPESIYSVPVDASPPGSIGPASLVRAYGYSNVELVPRVDPSGQLDRPPQLSERVSFPPASDSDGSAAIPPQLPARPNSLKPATSLESESENINGRLVASSQTSGRRSESGTSSSLHSQQKPSRSKAPRNKKPSKPFTNSSGLSTDSSSGRENTAPVHSNQVATLHHQAARGQSPETSHHNGSTSSHREWWNPLLGATRNSVQSDHTSEASSVWAAPQEMVVGTIPVCQHAQDKHEVVESWLGKVKPQVPF